MTPNTKIEYLYRDADNYKVHNEAIIQGLLSPEQQKIILSCLDEGEYFIPHLVGLPETRFDDYLDAVDHPWFELGKHSFQETTAPATVNISSEQLVQAFQQCKNKWLDLDLPVNASLQTSIDDPIVAITRADEIRRIQPQVEAQIRILANKGHLNLDEELFCNVYAYNITREYVRSIHQWEQMHGADIPFHISLERMLDAVDQMASKAKSPAFPQDNLTQTDLYQNALDHFNKQAQSNIENDFTRAHAAELILCYEHQMDLLDFDYWTKYEGLLGERLTLDEYITVDRLFAGDPLEITSMDTDVIDLWRADLEDYREQQPQTLVARIQSATEQIPSHSIQARIPELEPEL